MLYGSYYLAIKWLKMMPYSTISMVRKIVVKKWEPQIHRIKNREPYKCGYRMIALFAQWPSVCIS